MVALRTFVLLVVLGLATPLGAQECRERIEVKVPFEGAVRIELSDPCLAGQPVTFRHGDERIVRFADEQGRVSLLRLLDPQEPDRIVRIRDGEERVVFEEGAGSAKAAPAETVAAPSSTEATAGTAPASPAPSPPVPPRTPAARGQIPPPPAQERETAISRESVPAPTPRTPVAPDATPPPPRTPAPCRLAVRSEVRAGLARIHYEGPCPAGTPVTLRLEERGWVFHRSLDDRGRGELVVPLLDPRSRLVVETPGAPPVQRTLEFPDRRRMFRVVLEWDGAADLDLHVLEPGGRLRGRARHVWAANPDGGGKARGRLERADDGRRLGTKLESYAVARRTLRGALLRLLVVNVDRGRTTAPPYCSGGELARLPFRIHVLARDKVETRSWRFEDVPCGKRLGDRRYYLPVGRVRVR